MRTICLTIALAAVWVAPASAATVQSDGAVARFVASGGEANIVSVRAGSNGAVVFADAGAPLVAGAGCAARADGDVECSDWDTVRIELGDRGDRFDAARPLHRSTAVVEGGTGDDELRGEATLHGGDGRDALEGPVVEGGADDDRVRGTHNPGGVRDLLHGGAGDDEIVSLGGTDILDGGPGSDRLEAAGPADTPLSPSSFSNGAILIGGDGGDVLVGTHNLDEFEPGSGDDVVFSGLGYETVSGGPGDDRLVGGPGRNVLLGGEGADRLVGEDGDDLLGGGPGDDALDGGAGRDSLWGGAPSDERCATGGLHGCSYVDGNAAPDGADVLRGGPDGDSVSYRGRSEGVVVDLAVAGGDGTPGEGDSVAPDVEAVIGTHHDDVLRGTDGAEGLSGGVGNDRLFGRGGQDALSADASDGLGPQEEGLANSADVLDGGGGDDSLTSDRGADVIRGGAGDDLFHVTSNPLPVPDVVGITYDDRIDCGPGNDFGYAGATDVPAPDCETILEVPGFLRHRLLEGTGAVELDVRCGSAAAGACRGRAELRVRMTRVRRRVALPAGVRGRVVLPLPRRVQRVLARGAELRASAVVTLRDRRGRRFRTSRVQLLRRPRPRCNPFGVGPGSCAPTTGTPTGSSAPG